MRTSKFSEEQIVGLLREAEKGEQTLDALCRARGITVGEHSADFYSLECHAVPLDFRFCQRQVADVPRLIFGSPGIQKLFRIAVGIGPVG
jgi:hypothetical protein